MPDADTRFLERSAANLEVWRSDVVREPVAESAFDLVQCASDSVLLHLPERERVLENLASG